MASWWTANGTTAGRRTSLMQCFTVRLPSMTIRGVCWRKKMPTHTNSLPPSHLSPAKQFAHRSLLRRHVWISPSLPLNESGSGSISLQPILLAWYYRKLIYLNGRLEYNPIDWCWHRTFERCKHCTHQCEWGELPLSQKSRYLETCVLDATDLVWWRHSSSAWACYGTRQRNSDCRGEKPIGLAICRADRHSTNISFAKWCWLVLSLGIFSKWRGLEKFQKWDLTTQYECYKHAHHRPRMEWESSNLPEAWKKFLQHVQLIFDGLLGDKYDVIQC